MECIYCKGTNAINRSMGDIIDVFIGSRTKERKVDLSILIIVFFLNIVIYFIQRTIFTSQK
jgi:hypothetical protein